MRNRKGAVFYAEKIGKLSQVRFLRYGLIVLFNLKRLQFALVWKTAYIMDKKQINRGVKSMSKKALSWSQVCKQLSGIGGYVEISKDEKVRPLELMRSLGVNVQKNSYRPADIFAAVSEKMKENGQVRIMKSVPLTFSVAGEEYAVYVEKEGKKVQVRKYVLVNLVSASDKEKGSADTIVTAANVLRMLKQSLYVDETMAKIEKSAKSCEEITDCFVNVGKADSPIWIELTKGEDGEFHVKGAEIEEAA